MPATAFLVVPAGTVLPPQVLASTVKDWGYEVDSDDIAVDTAIDVFDEVERDIYQLDLDDMDLDNRVGVGGNLVPDAPWSAVFHTYSNEDDIFATVHRGGEMGQVIFCGDGDVRLQLCGNYSVSKEALESIVTFGRLVRAINPVVTR